MNIEKIKSYCLGFAFDDLGRVALIQKQHPEWQKGRFNGVGGLIEDGEDPTTAMIREFKEETGVETRAIRWTHFGTMKGIACWNVELFHYQGAEIRDVRTAETECVELYTANEVKTLPTIENIPALLELAKLCAKGDPLVTITYEK